MIKKRFGMLATILVFCGTLGVLAQTKGKKTTPYCSIDELPDACVYLPAPPDVTEAAFVDDYNQYLWGKSVRPTARGKRASWEARFGVARMATVYGEAMNITISQQGTPALWRFIQRVGDTGSRSTTKAKRNYMRVRPFARMNEPMASEFDDEKGLRTNGSYPSGHTGLGWAVALALAEMAPEYQDTILRRGFEYGQNRIIVGAHWQSDVNAGYLTASAAFAKMHTSPEYWADLKAARAEYRRIKGLKNGLLAAMGYPKGRKVLDAPVDTALHRFQGDWACYWSARQERRTDRGWQAVQDTACSESGFLKHYAPCVKVALTAEETPAIAALVSKVIVELRGVSSESRSIGFRKRPFVQFADETPVPAIEESYRRSSSYPSSHALLGWGIALALVEVAPDCQDAILQRGFEYGRSRIILGLHYASDVQAGRIIAACALARMHNDDDFLKLMEAAKKEYTQVKAKYPFVPAAKMSPQSSEEFVNLTDAVPDAILEIRYYSTYNFVGMRIDGYEEPTALITRRAADSLRVVSDELKRQGYRLKIYDAYRPQCAVDHFVRWAADVNDTLMKPYFYPDLDKKVLFPRGYIAERSGHTRGSTVDLTLFDMKTEKELDMGGTFDWFGRESHPDFCGNPTTFEYRKNGRITSQQFHNRMILRQAMMHHGFKPVDTEWWHFTLKDEPFPDTYFIFPVKRLQ